MQLHCTFLYNFFFSLRTVLYISALSTVEHPEGNKLKTLHCLSGSPCCTETDPRRLPATTHTTVLVTPRTRRSQWLGRYTDKITHSPATSPFPTFIKSRPSYLMWTVHTVHNVYRGVCPRPKMVVSLFETETCDMLQPLWSQGNKNKLWSFFPCCFRWFESMVYTKNLTKCHICWSVFSLRILDNKVAGLQRKALYDA